MIYRAIGVMSGSSLDGLDIAYAELTETGGKWNYELLAAQCHLYSDDWIKKLSNATRLSAMEYQLLHTSYGNFIGAQVNHFIDAYNLQHKVHLIASHGHTTFHLPAKKMTAQLGDGAAIAAATKLPTVSDLRALDIAYGGQGAPIVPIGEKLLLGEYDLFLNIGGIANISLNDEGKYIAFDVCAANRVLNLLAGEKGLSYDAGGALARSGKVNELLLQQLNSLQYYIKPYPKSLANDFGTGIVYPLIKNAGISNEDALRTYAEHICVQIDLALTNATGNEKSKIIPPVAGQKLKMLVTGGGAFNSFLMERLQSSLAEKGITVVVPGDNLVQYKEALVMALIGVLRWREEANVLSSVTGATQDSIGGALWLGGGD